MEIGLNRRHFKDTYTIGRLYIDSQYFCDTLEDKVRELHDINHDNDFNDLGEGKIYGETAIPCGRYKIDIIWWKKHQKEVPRILNVPGFTGILIHSGSDPKHTEGCILVGENKNKGRLINSPYYATTLTNNIKEAISDHQEIWITIKQ